MATIAASLSAGATTRPATASRTGGPVDNGGNRAGWLMSTPFLLIYGLFIIVSIAYGVVMSFFNTSAVTGGLGHYVGVANYREALHSSDFWKSMEHTLVFTVISTPILVVLSLVFAVLSERIPHGRWFYRLAFFAPFVVPVSSVTFIFLWMYAAKVGIVTKIFTGLGLADPNILARPNWAMGSVILLTLWWTLGFNYVLYLAALQDIDVDLYEAAAMDGASPWQQIRSITLPLLSRTTFLVVVLQLLASLQVFQQIYLLLSGGPNYSTRPVVEYIYDVGFTNYRAGYGAAVTMLYFVVLLIVSLFWFLLNRHRAKGQV